MLVESARALRARPRDPERRAVHLPRRRAARGATEPRGRAAPRARSARRGRAARRAGRLGPARRGGRRRGRRLGRAARALRRRAARAARRPRRRAARRCLAALRRRARGSPGASRSLDGAWVAAERREAAADLASTTPRQPTASAGTSSTPARSTIEDLVDDGELGAGPLRGAPLCVPRARTAMAALEAQGYAIALPDGRWCARHLLVRCHGLARQRRRRRIEPVGLADYVDFLCEWQRVEPASALRGPRRRARRRSSSSRGSSCPRATGRPTCCPRAWRTTTRTWLDELCLSGEVAWARLTPRPGRRPRASRLGDAVGRDAALARAPRRPRLAAARGAARRGPRPAAPRRVARPARRARAPRRAVPRGARRLVARACPSRWTRGCGTSSPAASRPPTRSRRSARSSTPARGSVRDSAGCPSRGSRGAPRRAQAGTGVGEGRWSVVASPPGEPDGRRARGAGRARRDPAARSLGRRRLRAHEPRERAGAVAPRRLGAAPPRGARRGRRRAVRRGASPASSTRPRTPPRCCRRVARAAAATELTLSGSDPINLTGTVLPGPRVPAVRHRRVTVAAGDVTDAAS